MPKSGQRGASAAMRGSRRLVGLGRFFGVRPIRRGGAVELYSARSARDGSSRLVLMSTADADAGFVAPRFDELSRAHKLLAHARVPRVVGRGSDGGVEYVELECDAIADVREVCARLAQRGEKLALSAVAALARELFDILREAHETRDPRTRRPLCIGALSAANVLFSARGDLWLLGFGCNVGPDAGSGAPLESPFLPLEVALGESPTPASDLVCLTFFLRSLLPHVRVPPSLRRAILRPETGTRELVRLVSSLERSVTCGKPTGAQLARIASRLGDALGLRADPEALKRQVSDALGMPTPAPRAASVVLGPDASFVQIGNRQRRLRSRVLVRILHTLAESHRRDPEAVVDVQTLIAAAWPGERLRPEVGKNRVYVAIATLRRMYLQGGVEHTGVGYRLRPDLQLFHDPLTHRER